VVRCELVMPLELAGVRIERDYGGAVEVVALALVAVIVGAWVTGGPVQQLDLGVVGSGEPGGGAAVLDRPAHPGLRSRLAPRGDRPEPPGMLACGSLVGVHKSTDAFIATRYARNHQVIDNERRAGGAVILAMVGRLDLPDELAGEAMQAMKGALSGTMKPGSPSTATPRLMPLAASPGLSQCRGRPECPIP